MGVTNLDTIVSNGVQVNPYHYEVIRAFVSGVQTTGTKKSAAIVSFAGTIVDVRTYLDTAPTGATFISDVNINGTTAFTTQGSRPTIAISGNASTTTLPDVVAVAAGDRITIDIDQIGSGTAGSDLYVAITIKRLNA